MDETVQLTLTKAQALLLYKGLHRLEEKNLLESTLPNEEQHAFRALEAALNKNLPVFDPDYRNLVAAARKELQQGGAISDKAPRPRLVLIAAMSRNRVLATADGKIPWHLPRDTAHFRARAAGRWLLLGRRTFEQMHGWFQPDQVPLVLTKDPAFPVPGGFACASVESALQEAQAHGADELLVCGGGQVYAATLPCADEVILTTVEAEFDGTVFFPELPEAEWRMESETHFPPDAVNPLGMRITNWLRISGSR
jgi:dihydrofolate reductase